MKIKLFGVAIILVFTVLRSQSLQASGGIMALTADDFTSRVEGNSYIIESKDKELKITIENGVITVTKDNNTIKLTNTIELNGTVVVRDLDNPINNTTLTNNNTVTTTNTTATNSTTTTPGFTSKVIKHIGF